MIKDQTELARSAPTVSIHAAHGRTWAAHKTEQLPQGKRADHVRAYLLPFIDAVTVGHPVLGVIAQLHVAFASCRSPNGGLIDEYASN